MDIEVFPTGIHTSAHAGLRACRCKPRWVGSTVNGDWVFVHRDPGAHDSPAPPVEKPVRCVRATSTPSGLCRQCGRPVFRCAWNKSGFTHEVPPRGTSWPTTSAEPRHPATARASAPALPIPDGRSS